MSLTYASIVNALVHEHAGVSIHVPPTSRRSDSFKPIGPPGVTAGVRSSRAATAVRSGGVGFEADGAGAVAGGKADVGVEGSG
jgi:hypothetical protein